MCRPHHIFMEVEKMIQEIKKQTRRAYELLWDATQIKPAAHDHEETDGDSRMRREGWIKIITPHQDRHGECLVVYARKTTRGFAFTDDSLSYNDYLGASGDLGRDDFAWAVHGCCPAGDVKVNDDDAIVVYVDRNAYAEGLRATVSVILAMGGFAAYAAIKEKA